MKKLMSLFPWSRVKKGNLIGLIIAIVVYLVIAALLGWVLSIVGSMPIIGLITGIVSTIIWIYEVIGIVLAVLSFLNIV